MTAEYPTIGGPELAPIVLERIRAKVTERVSASVAAGLTVSARPPHGLVDHVAGAVALDVEAEIWTERLPPQRVAVDIDYEHPEAVGQGGTAIDVRYATWFDHFAATYRRRWWARLLGLRRYALRYTEVKVPYVVVAPVRCRHRVVVDIADTWRYPDPPGLPGEMVGPSVLVSSASGNAKRYGYDRLREAMDYRRW